MNDKERLGIARNRRGRADVRYPFFAGNRPINLNVTISDFSYFDSVDVCKYLPEWTEVAVDGTFTSPGDKFNYAWHVTIFAPTELNITLFQESNR